VSSGTDALVLALRAIGVGPGDEVIVPDNSFVATAEAVSIVGATPRFVDVDPRSALVTAEIVEASIGPQTRCVIPVHLYGRTVDLKPILAVARDRDVAVIEDACQAHGAMIDGQRAGSVGDAGCFSFYPAKNLGAWGDGGAVVTNDRVLADRVRRLRSHGEARRYQHEVIGATARLDALQAAILRVKLPRLDESNASRRRVGAALVDSLSGADVTPPAPVADHGDHVFHQFVIESDDRDGLRKRLADQRIDSAIHYPVPIHLTAAYTWCGFGNITLPVVERLARRVCSLPIFPGMTGPEIARVADAVVSFRARATRLP
jgi:dTDP-3-amino-3,4,6-trideoxy-alpha-D-glucose transaminase